MQNFSSPYLFDSSSEFYDQLQDFGSYNEKDFNMEQVPSNKYFNNDINSEQHLNKQRPIIRQMIKKKKLSLNINSTEVQNEEILNLIVFNINGEGFDFQNV